MVLPRLAILTGLTPETLRMLLPAIARVEARTTGEVVRYRRHLYVACSHCMHRRGITGPVLAQLPPKEAIYGNIIRRRVDEREYIATYPEFVTLLGILADPAWRALREPGRRTSLSQHRRTIDTVYTEAEHRLNVPTLREKLRSHAFSNDPLFRWTDSLGRSLMLVTTPDDYDALRDESHQN